MMVVGPKVLDPHAFDSHAVQELSLKHGFIISGVHGAKESGYWRN